MPAGLYHAWLVETEDGAVVSGGGMTVIPWPPGPRYPGGQVAFAYNVYTEPEHRRRGLGRLVMDTMHAYCRAIGVSAIVLNASHVRKANLRSDGLPCHREPDDVSRIELKRAGGQLRPARSPLPPPFSRYNSSALGRTAAGFNPNRLSTETREHAFHHHRPLHRDQGHRLR